VINEIYGAGLALFGSIIEVVWKITGCAGL
jgi:hypothetical protein